MMNKLSIVANQCIVGTLCYDDSKLSLEYDSSWVEHPEAFPISVSLPLSATKHKHSTIEAYLWGLLPDNQAILEHYGKQFHVSPRNGFHLLMHMGKDCPGAIQFISEQDQHTLIETRAQDCIEWLSQAKVEELIEQIKQNQGVQRMDASQGQFSLAGAQPKTALYRCPDTGRWGVPSGVTPTTHILKPALGEFDGFAENEHYCLTLAAAIGLPTPKSWVESIAEIPVIIVERYDRFLHQEQYYRIHQEDFCQARGVHPENKYQSQGGPSVADLSDTLWQHSSEAYEDALSLADALIFNYLIMGTDAHAKNYSLLLAGGGAIRLAPFYDIASALPYRSINNPHKVKMAMKIGSSYHFKKIEQRHWETCAKQLNLSPKELLKRFKNIASSLLTHTQPTADKLHQQGLNHPVIDQLSQAIQKRCSELSSF